MSQQVYEILKSDILSQRLGFGEKLTNASLQERYQVGAMPIRDAIIRLYQEGLVSEVTKSGVRVLTLDLKDALEANEITSLLCTSAVRLCETRADPDKLCARLENVLAVQEKNNGSEKYFALDDEFHCVFFNFIDNAQYEKVYHQYSSLLEMIVRSILKNGFQGRHEEIALHREILIACKSRKFNAAACSMQRHFDKRAELIKRYFSENNA